MICSQPLNSVTTTVNLAVHVFILFCFLSVFFVFYIANIVKHSFEKELEHNIKGNIDAQFNKLDPALQNQVGFVVDKLPLSDLKKKYDKPSAELEMNNKWLFRVVLILNIAMFSIIGISVFILTKLCNQCIPMKEILIENAIIFSMVGVIEFMFFKYVILKYIPVVPSTMVTTFVESMKKRL